MKTEFRKFEAIFRLRENQNIVKGSQLWILPDLISRKDTTLREK